MNNYVNKAIICLAMIIMYSQSIVDASENNRLIIEDDYFNTDTNYVTKSFQSTGCLINVEYSGKLFCEGGDFKPTINTLIDLRELDFGSIEVNDKFVKVKYNTQINGIIEQSNIDTDIAFPKPLKGTTPQELYAKSIDRSIYQLMLTKSRGMVSQFSITRCDGTLVQHNTLRKVGFSIKPEYSDLFMKKLKTYAVKYCSQ